jgi:hypothetical protein
MTVFALLAGLFSIAVGVLIAYHDWKGRRKGYMANLANAALCVAVGIMCIVIAATRNNAGHP